MRYVLKFSKDGALKYISHLDMIRLFKRLFKRAEIELSYSQGFNPHPKMAFTLPLSLGYSSLCESMEFECERAYGEAELLGRLSDLAPEGIGFIYLRELPKDMKSLASLVCAASYVLRFPKELSELCGGLSPDEAVAAFLSCERIEAEKAGKKGRDSALVDIKPMIFELGARSERSLYAKLAAGSARNLSPELLFRAFADFFKADCDRAETEFQREEIFFANNFEI